MILLYAHAQLLDMQNCFSQIIKNDSLVNEFAVAISSFGSMRHGSQANDSTVVVFINILNTRSGAPGRRDVYHLTVHSKK
jgi:hypothetical protein